MSKPNPIKQGIALANTLGAIQTLQSAVSVVDAMQDDKSLDSVRAHLDTQLQRYKAELDALINLYGG